MNERRTPLEKEEPKHKKRSKKRGQPRADHKHEYKTVLLYLWSDPSWISGERTAYEVPKKVCMICGRVGDTDMNQYELVNAEEPIPYHTKKRVIKNPESLEIWDCDFFGKFAKKRVATDGK